MRSGLLWHGRGTCECVCACVCVYACLRARAFVYMFACMCVCLCVCTRASCLWAHAGCRNACVLGHPACHAQKAAHCAMLRCTIGTYVPDRRLQVDIQHHGFMPQHGVWCPKLAH